ncbi:hypothetical protein DDE18_04675 [Nocardioides gansuensis]|uniref:Fungal lipase-type domain-containing protein n=1 Tax=Nocardioides gansuensis TaxID=2138300 RepID=A0A2T8FD39_9ACTN|nr:lipase family protein [Nocardioides gansuensis]PVG83627.1 hypothetical protein DDE18_04675 [Nocardioides gansuensis]
MTEATTDNDSPLGKPAESTPPGQLPPTRSGVFTLDSRGPDPKALEPLKDPAAMPRFPVYPNLAETLNETVDHPDDTVARVLATCAGYGYSTADTVAMIMSRLGLERNNTRMVALGVDAMLIVSTAFLVQSEDGRVVILAYRGTEPDNVISWLTDLDVYTDTIQLETDTGAAGFEVHAGFYRNVRATRHEVLAALQRALDGRSVTEDGSPVDHPMESLYITGHSLGAAMAALMAVMLVEDDDYAPIAEKLRAVYTFGQPMVGSPAFADHCAGLTLRDGSHLQDRLIRYIHRRDVVPRLPPRISGRYQHFGLEYEYKGEWPWQQNTTAAGQVRGLTEFALVPLDWAERRLRLVPIASRLRPFLYSLDDHGPLQYIRALTPPGEPTEFGD